MEHNALASDAQVRRLFPQESPLYALVAPTFDSVRSRLGGLSVSTIWIDADLDPSRAGFRPSYDRLHGEGASTMMPFIGTWLSTGPGAGEDGNTVLLLDTVDRGVIDYARDIGTLGDYTFVSSLEDIRETVRSSGRKLYSIDDVGGDFDEHSAVSSELSGWLNSKDALASISRYAPVEVVKDMYGVGVADFRATKRPGARVFLKTCNTESAGRGVEICSTEDEFVRILADLRSNQARFGLSRTLVVQPELTGRNRSFQVFLEPEHRDEIQVVGLSDQFVEADGKTYKGSVNYPVAAETLEPVGPVIVDMVARIWRRFPEAFGFLMCDFFETPDGERTVYDPGIRPTGNTPTAMVSLFAQKLVGQHMFVSNFFLDTGKRGLRFSDLVARTGPLTEPENLAREGLAVFPWGWNPILGQGILIGVAPDQATHETLVQHVRGIS